MRDLQACIPDHDGSSFTNMFHDEELWITSDIASPLRLKWDYSTCELVIAHLDGELGQKYAYVFEDESGYDAYVFDNLEAAYNRMHESNSNLDKAVFYVGGGEPNPHHHHIQYNGLQQQNWTNYQVNGNLTLLLDAATWAMGPNVMEFSWEKDEVTKLLNGDVGLITKMAYSAAGIPDYYSRIITKNQIRVITHGFYYINRKFVHPFLGQVYSDTFSRLHSSTGGYNETNQTLKALPVCENFDDEPINPSGSATGLCCGNQCTSYTQYKVWKSVLCEISVSDCYNPLLESCSTVKMPCEYIIADPEDQVHAQYPLFRNPIPHENIWQFLANEDFNGGQLVGFTRKVENGAEMDVRHSIPFDDTNDGNGRYEFVYSIASIPTFNQGNQQIGTLMIYSYTMNEVLDEMILRGNMLSGSDSWIEITREITMADRHLGDLGIKIVSVMGGPPINVDTVTIKYIFYETLSPTSFPSISPSALPSTSPSEHPTRSPTRSPTSAPTALSVCGTLLISVFTDNYPYETTWQVRRNSDGAIIDSGGPYSQQLYTHNHYSTVCENECYTYNMWDTAHDGVCCGYGIGYFYGYFNNGPDILQGNFEFGHFFSRGFCL